MLFPAAAAGTAFLPRLQGIPARRESPLMGRGLPTSRMISLGRGREEKGQPLLQKDFLYIHSSLFHLLPILHAFDQKHLWHPYMR